MTLPSLAARVVRWQRQHGRHGLPWQGTRDPYRVWLSEVMLQQTQVTTVLDYYGRFLQRFPSVVELAAAPLDDVLALWSGLGYYSRARNLHRCAQTVVDEHAGQFPNSSQALQALPGIGRSTAAAIAAFCFGERVAILDGNVKRVLARALGFEGDLAVARELDRLWELAQGLLPQQGVEAYTQGLMDLGATVCSARGPDCARCPLATTCVAKARGEPQRFPVKTRKLKRSHRENAVLLLCHGQRHGQSHGQRQLWRVLLVQRPPTGVWAGLWALPEYPSVAELDALSAHWPGQGEWLPTVHHVLTHLDWDLHPLRWDWAAKPAPPSGLVAQGRWCSLDEALALGLPAPVRKLLLTAGG